MPELRFAAPVEERTRRSGRAIAAPWHKLDLTWFALVEQAMNKEGRAAADRWAVPRFSIGTAIDGA